MLLLLSLLLLVFFAVSVIVFVVVVVVGLVVAVALISLEFVYSFLRGKEVLFNKSFVNILYAKKQLPCTFADKNYC